MLIEEQYPNTLNASGSTRCWLQAAAVSLVTAVLVAAPFFRLGIMVGHDFAFHMTSWMDVVQQWKEGIHYPRWTEWANGGYGEPRFLFYPPLSWLLGAVLGLVAPWKDVQGLFVVVVQAFAGLSMFAFARRFLSQRGSLLAAIAYGANPYIFLDVYMRSAFAEQLACAVMPLVVLAALELSGLIESRGRSPWQGVAFFAIPFAVVWLANVPSGVMESYSVALIFAWAALEKRAWQPLLRGARGLALGFGLAGFYLLPVAFEKRWINTQTLVPEGYVPLKHFLYAQPYRDIEFPKVVSFNWYASSVSVLMIVALVISAIAVYRGILKARQDRDLMALWRVFLVLSAAATFLLFHASWILWRYLPKLAFVQFPWRWLAILSIPYTFFLVKAIEQRRLRWTGAMAIILIGGVGTYIVQSCRSEGRWVGIDVTTGMHQDFIDGDNGFLGTQEYFPGGEGYQAYFIAHIPEKRPRVQILTADGSGLDSSKANVQIEKWNAEEKELQVTSKEPVRVGLRLLNYPAWRVEVNGKPAKTELSNPMNQIILPVPEGRSEIRVRFTRTADRILGWVLSVACMLAVAATLVFAWLAKRRTIWNLGGQILGQPEPIHNPGDSAAA